MVYAINAIHLWNWQLCLMSDTWLFSAYDFRHVNTFVNETFSAEFYDSFLLVIFISILRIFVFNFHVLTF